MKISIIGTTMPNMAASMEDLTKLSGHAAGVCYMPDTFGALMCEPKEKTMRRANGTKASGHHSVFDHAFINLSLENIPKGLAMVLNNEQFYNTSEKSARYTKMVLKEGEQKLFDKWLDTYKNLLTEAEKTSLKGKITGADVSNPAALTLTYDGRITIKLGTFVDIPAKLKLAAGAVEKEDRIDSTEYGTLDATITDKAYFRPEAKKSETPSAEQTTAEISPEQAVE